MADVTDDGQSHTEVLFHGGLAIGYGGHQQMAFYFEVENCARLQRLICQKPDAGFRYVDQRCVALNRGIEERQIDNSARTKPRVLTALRRVGHTLRSGGSGGHWHFVDVTVALAVV